MALFGGVLVVPFLVGLLLSISNGGRFFSFLGFGVVCCASFCGGMSKKKFCLKNR